MYDLEKWTKILPLLGEVKREIQKDQVAYEGTCVLILYKFLNVRVFLFYFIFLNVPYSSLMI